MYKKADKAKKMENTLIEHFKIKILITNLFANLLEFYAEMSRENGIVK